MTQETIRESNGHTPKARDTARGWLYYQSMNNIYNHTMHGKFDKRSYEHKHHTLRCLGLIDTSLTALFFISP